MSIPNRPARAIPWGITIRFTTGFKVAFKNGEYSDAIYAIGAYAGNPDKDPLEVDKVTIALSPGEHKSQMEEFTRWLNLNQLDYEVLW